MWLNAGFAIPHRNEGPAIYISTSIIEMKNENHRKIIKKRLIQNPNDFIFLFYYSLFTGKDKYLHRTLLIQDDILSGIPVDKITFFINREIGTSLWEKIYETQIKYCPKAVIFAFRSVKNSNPDMRSALFVNLNPQHEAHAIPLNDPDFIIERLSKYFQNRPRSTNTSSIILAKDFMGVDMRLVRLMQNPVICCWNESSNESYGTFRKEKEYSVYFGDLDYYIRLREVLKYIENDFVIILGDDDFVFDPFLRKAEIILKNNPSLISVSGIGSDASVINLNGDDHIRVIRLKENPISVRDARNRAKEWALFGGLSMNSIFRLDHIKNIMEFLPDKKFGSAREYFIDIASVLLGPSINVNEVSVLRARRPNSGTYTALPPLLHSTTFELNLMHEIAQRLSVFARRFDIEIEDDIINWVVTYGSTSRLLENSAYNGTITTLPKALANFQDSRYYPNLSRSDHFALLLASLLLFSGT